MSRFNFDGYELKKWLKANNSDIRLVVSGVVGLLTMVSSNLQYKWSVPLGGMAVIASKWVLDGLDYFIKE